MNLRDHPHVHGLLAGLLLLGAAAVASPLALDAVTGIVGDPGAVTDDKGSAEEPAKVASGPEVEAKEADDEPTLVEAQ